MMKFDLHGDLYSLHVSMTYKGTFLVDLYG